MAAKSGSDKGKFTIDDAPTLAGSRAIIPMIGKAIAFLDALPDGRLLSTERLAEEMHIGYAYLHSKGRFIPAEYSTLSTSRKKIYGNPKTVKEYRETYGV